MSYLFPALLGSHTKKKERKSNRFARARNELHLVFVLIEANIDICFFYSKFKEVSCLLWEKQRTHSVLLFSVAVFTHLFSELPVKHVHV